MSLELDNDGPFSQRRSQDSRGNQDARGTVRRQDDAPAWPVLARLPRVDGPGAAPPRTPLPTFASEPLVGEAPLQYVGDSPLRYTDAPHAAQRYDLHVEPVAQYAAVAAPTLAFTPPSQQSALSRRYRFDQGDAAHYAPRSHRARSEEQPSFSDAIFRAHAALAPHMGRVSAAALLLAAGFVYWLAIGRQQGITPPVERLQFGAGLTQEVQAPSTSPVAPTAAPELEPATTTAAPEASVSAIDEPKIDAPVNEWTTPPRVAEAPAPIEAAATPAPAPAATTTDPAPSAGPALTPPSPTTAPINTVPSDSASAAVAAPQASQPATELDNGITPTPELDAYPSTSFPPFSFVDQTPIGPAPAVATAPNAPAQR